MSEKINRAPKPKAQEVSSEEVELNDVVIDEYLSSSGLYGWGLVDVNFLEGLDEESKRFLREVLLYNSRRSSSGAVPEPSILIEKGVLTKADFERYIVAPAGIDPERLARVLIPYTQESDLFSKLIDAGVLNSYTLWHFFLSKENNFFNKALDSYKFDWDWFIGSGLLELEVNSINQGFDAVEYQALQKDLLEASQKTWSYPLDKTIDPLAHKLRAQEHTQEVSGHIVKALEGGQRVSTMEDFSKVFDACLLKAPLYQELLHRDTIPEAERTRERHENVALVNACQQDAISEERFWDSPAAIPDPSNRFIDIYARYEHGKMDPLRLAFIARAVGEYVMKGRSKLFTGVRVIPNRNIEDQRDRTPWIALAACHGATLLPVEGGDFRDSILGANRFFFTHSNAAEAANLHSVPIIGLASYQNEDKRPKNEKDFVVFHGAFDMLDSGRRTTLKPWQPAAWRHRRDVQGDLPALVNETLQVLMEVEKKEIGRAREHQRQRTKEARDKASSPS